MEPLSERCYPSNYFDPFMDEPTHASCCECGEVFDISDMEYETSGGQDFYYCQDCFSAREDDYGYADQKNFD